MSDQIWALLKKKRIEHNPGYPTFCLFLIPFLYSSAVIETLKIRGWPSTCWSCGGKPGHLMIRWTSPHKANVCVQVWVEDKPINPSLLWILRSPVDYRVCLNSIKATCSCLKPITGKSWELYAKWQAETTSWGVWVVHHGSDCFWWLSFFCITVFKGLYFMFYTSSWP